MMEDLNTEAGLRSAIVNKAIERLGEDRQTLELLYVNNDQVPEQIRTVISDMLGGKISSEQAKEVLADLRRDPNLKVPDFGGTFRTIPAGPFAGMIEVVPHKSEEPVKEAAEALRDARGPQLEPDVHFSDRLRVKDLDNSALVREYGNQQRLESYEEVLVALDSQVLKTPRIMEAPLLRSPRDVIDKLRTLTSEEKDELKPLSSHDIDVTIRRIEVIQELGDRLTDILDQARKSDPSIIRSAAFEMMNPKGGVVRGFLVDVLLRTIPVNSIAQALSRRVYTDQNLYRLQERARFAVSTLTKMEQETL